MFYFFPFRVIFYHYFLCSSPHRKAFKPPRMVSKTPEKTENPKKGILKKSSKYKTPEKKSRESHKEEISNSIREERSFTPEKSTWKPSNEKKMKYESPGKKEKQKIKIRVQVEKNDKKPHRSETNDKKPDKSEAKKSKSETADALVKLLVPYFKKGQIASKEVFKTTARELTHSLLKRSKQLSKEDYAKFVDKFFDTCGGILLNEQDAKNKIDKYKYIE